MVYDLRTVKTRDFDAPGLTNGEAGFREAVVKMQGSIK
jgi:hypothetical protein